MCRLAYLPSGTKLNKEELTSFFTQLEKSFGGDGNGFAAISPKGTLTINKAVNFKCEDIAEEVEGLLANGWAIYFHTRKTSIGCTTDEQCHPFRIKGPAWQGSLCHNGTWNDGGIIAKYLGVGSDTAAMAHMIGEIGVEEIEKRKIMPKSGVFLLYGNKPGDSPSHSVLKLGGSLEYCPETGIWASEFFNDWPHYSKTYEVKTGIWNLNGDAPEKSLYTSNYRSNNGYTGTYYNQSVGYHTSTTTKPKSLIPEDDMKEISNSLKDEEMFGDRKFYHISM